MVSGGRLQSNGDIRWDHEAIRPETGVTKTTRFGNAQEPKS